MSLYWRSYKSNQNIDLPKNITRPFWHPVAEKLDDKIFSTTLHHAKPRVIPYIVLFLSLPLFYISISEITYLLKSIDDFYKWSDENIYFVTTHLIVFLVASLFVYLFFKMIIDRNLQLNRQQHTVNAARHSLMPRYLNYNYDDVSGAIECYKNPFGKRKSWLVLKHKSDRHTIRLCHTYDSPQALLGYWSFIVQFMKKDSPLPDVPALHEYPDKIEGVMPGSTAIQ